MYEIIRERIVRNTTDLSPAIRLAHIVCDSVSEMPVPESYWIAGTICEVLENGRKIYKLSNNREWIEVSVSSHDDDSHKKSKLIIGGVCLAGKPDFDEEQIQKLLEQMDYDGSEVIILD